MKGYNEKDKLYFYPTVFLHKLFTWRNVLTKCEAWIIYMISHPLAPAQEMLADVDSTDNIQGNRVEIMFLDPIEGKIDARISCSS